MNNDTEKKSDAAFERLGGSLYWKGGKIVARVRVNGKPTWRSTGTDNPAEARKWLKKWKSEEWAEEHGFEPQGVVLHRQQVKVSQILEDYLAAGCPARNAQPKSQATTRNEKFFLSPVSVYFGDKLAAAVNLGDCDKYRDWRLSGGYVSSYKVRGGHPRTMRTSGNRTVDLELTVLSNALGLAVRRNVLKANPLAGRGRYSLSSEIRHCREVAPTPEGLRQIESWLRSQNELAIADVVCFLAYSGLRVGEALPLTWGNVNWSEKLLHVKREKKGIVPWVPILAEMEALLKDMKKRSTEAKDLAAKELESVAGANTSKRSLEETAALVEKMRKWISSELLFPSPFAPLQPRDVSAIRHRIKLACKKLEIGHVTPHGLRSYFVTQARQSGLTDADIAALIGDKTGPAIIATTYGDVRPDHLLAQAQRIRLTVSSPGGAQSLAQGSSIKSSITSPKGSGCFTVSQQGAETQQARAGEAP